MLTDERKEQLRQLADKARKSYMGLITAASFGTSLVLEDEEYSAWEAMLIDRAVSDLLDETDVMNYENKAEDFAVVVSSPIWTAKAIEEYEREAVA